ncbi:MAG: AI-2E family transporter, partial [Chloroflexi bacterium]|nr:AI-2E family transporter [Chloroflexota bacterium]
MPISPSTSQRDTSSAWTISSTSPRVMQIGGPMLMMLPLMRSMSPYFLKRSLSRSAMCTSSANGALVSRSARDDPAAMPPETTGAAPSWAESWFNASSVFSYVERTLSSLAGVLSNLFLILITVIFILLEAATIPTKLRAMSGGSTQSLDNLDKIVATINQYMAIKTITSIVTGVLVTIWLSIVGVDFALLWGLFAFLLNYVPNIGSILAAVPAVLLAFVQLDLGSAAAAALGYAVINVLIGYVIEPRFMGRGLGLSTLVVFLSLV